MPKKKNTSRKPSGKGSFHIEFKNDAQSLAWAAFQQHDVLFMTGAAGTGKTHLACAFAIQEILNNDKKNIVLTRPIVESGESLGYLPGEFAEKVDPYMTPMWNCMDKLVGKHEENNPWRQKINDALEVAPLAYMRGRAQPLDSNILTPHGFVEMGSLKVGDEVIGSNGNSINIEAIWPQGVKDIYEVSFTDGTKTKCSEDHLWSTMTLNEKRHEKGYTTKTTKEISESVLNKHNQKIHRVPIISGPVCFLSKEISLDPYVMGILLGDGHIGKDCLRVSSVDEEIIEECKLRVPEGCELVFRSKIDFALVDRSSPSNMVLNEMKELGLCGSKSHTKFVPKKYKFNSEEIRMELLRGIMDADGWICTHRSGSCRIQYSSTSERLAEDVMFLVRSLGGYAYCRQRDFDESDTHVLDGKEVKHVHSAYVVDILCDFNPFKLRRKSSQFKPNSKPAKLINSVKLVGKEECQCITVDAKDHLYVTDDFILTHNSFGNSVCIFDEAQNATMQQLKMFLSRFEEDTKIIITGDPVQSDLPGSNVALVDTIHRLKSVPGVGFIQFKEQHIVRHPLVGKIMEALK